ncbi:MAG: NAD(P)H-dependent dehydrogenase/reductase [Desulfobacteraceae bacterium]|nr:MAG: NAD(P)H-dependent dehydrogenase/reductase [Desulfobacteraceae bacterium]
MFSSLIEKRRSIRRYEEKQVEPQKIASLVEASLRAPSSMGTNPWRFVVVTDKGILRKLSLAKEHGSSFLSGAPLGIAICADPSKSSVWIEDASIAATYIQLAAEDIGLSSCWIQIRERMHNKEKTSEQYIAELLNIPAAVRVEAIVAIGYPAEKKTPHSRDSLQYEKVYAGEYGRPYREGF